MPEISWKTPIFHPNISASGVVCLGGYGTYWVPSLTLDELCTMLWDMIRYENYDEKSPYNREAAGWIKTQEEFRMPLDTRPLRDRLAGYAPQPVASPHLFQFRRHLASRIGAHEFRHEVIPVEQLHFAVGHRTARTKTQFDKTQLCFHTQN